MSHAANAGPEQTGDGDETRRGTERLRRRTQTDGRDREYDGGVNKVTEMMWMRARELGNTRFLPFPPLAAQLPRGNHDACSQAGDQALFLQLSWSPGAWIRG